MTDFINEIENMAEIYHLVENEDVKKYILRKGCEIILRYAEKIELVCKKIKLIGYRIYEKNLIIKLKDELIIKTYYCNKKKGKKATLKDENDKKVKVDKIVLNFITEVLNEFWGEFEKRVKNG